MAEMEEHSIVDFSARAQTRVAFLNQLQSRGYPAEAIAQVDDAYWLARELFAGRYRASGDTFLSHLLATASVLARLDVAPELLQAAMLHSVYRHGDFGDGRSGITDAKRRSMHDRVGGAVEALLFAYATLRWDEKGLAGLPGRLGALSGPERDAVLLRLANEIDILADGDVCYAPNAARRLSALPRLAPHLDEVARQICPPLAEALRNAVQGVLHRAGQDRIALCRQPVKTLAPRSYRLRRRVVLERRLRRLVRTLLGLPSE
jgi:hypothetical protein